MNLNDKYANKTWYYGGRNLGNLTNMVSGAYSFVQGINTMALGVGGSSASMALTSTGAGSAIGIPVGVVSGATVAAGAAVTTFGGALTYSSASNFKNNWEKFKESKSRGGNKGGKKSPTSQNQMQKQVERGKAPKSVDRVDKPHVEGQQPHIHFGENEAALNNDGTWHDEGMKSIPKLDNKTIKWIIENGWKLPNE